MKIKNKLWIVSFFCLGAGVLLLVIGMLFGGKAGFYFDNTGFHGMGDLSSKRRVLEKTRIDSFDNMKLDLDYADLEIVFSDDYYLEYNLEDRGDTVSYQVVNKTLSLEIDVESKGWKFSFFSLGDIDDHEKNKVIISIPKDTILHEIEIVEREGDILMPDIRAERVKISNEYGELRIKDVTAEKVELYLSDGDISGGSWVSDDIHITNKYGDVKVDDIKGESLKVQLSDGDLEVNGLDIQQGDIQNQYGDVKLQMTDSLKDHSIDVQVEYGELSMPGDNVITETDGDRKSCKVEKDGDKHLRIHSQDGDVRVTEP